MTKWLVLFLMAILTLTTAASAQTAQTLTQADRDKAVAELEGSRQAFLDATQGLSPAQWNFKAGPDRWSIAECAEHIALAEDFIFGVATKRVMSTPATPEKRDLVKGKDEAIVKMLQDRSHKATAPEPIDPVKHKLSADEAVKQFLASRAHTIEYIKTTHDDLRGWLDACLDETTGRMEGPAVWQAWGVGSEKDAKNPEFIDHTGLIYGITGSGKRATLYAPSFKPAEIAHDVPLLASY